MPSDRTKTTQSYPQVLAGVRGVSRMLDVSENQVRAWQMHGVLPEPLRIADTRRVLWPVKVIEQWVADGCPPQGHGTCEVI